eukprot:g54603.t1
MRRESALNVKRNDTCMCQKLYLDNVTILVEAGPHFDPMTGWESLACSFYFVALMQRLFVVQMDYASLDEAPQAGTSPRVLWGLRLAGLTMASAAGWLGARAHQLHHFSVGDGQAAHSAHNQPAAPDGLRSLFRAGPPGPAQLLPLPADGPTRSPNALFLPHPPAALSAAASASSEAWLYCATPLADLVVGATGHPGDILRGRLLTWPDTAFQDVLKVLDHKTGLGGKRRARVERVVALVVLRNGTLREAHCYFQNNSKTLAAAELEAVSEAEEAESSVVRSYRDHVIHGSTMPVLEMRLQPGQTIFSESGELSWLTSSIEMRTGMQNAGQKQGLLNVVKRAIAGGSFFMTEYTAVGAPGNISFAAKMPGRFIPLDLREGRSYMVHRTGFVCGELGVTIELAWQRSFASGLFGGEGFVLQKVGGKGRAYISLGGEMVKYALKPGEVMRVHPGHVGIFEEQVHFSIVTIPGIANRLFGDGLFLVALKGPGTIWLQSLPLPQLASALKPYLSPGDKGRRL